ncbi:hypothetical protein GsuE55_07220 [Geobacillus subterraneus]|uniref:Uncharacterized protein n=1 Tax=Geobacillus subterraneus TaxID=129338 RepID=A0A679FLT2_9BACL|nr:hypothetical protein GsuE55_07220 [Geobacillus subterraneus]
MRRSEIPVDMKGRTYYNQNRCLAIVQCQKVNDGDGTIKKVVDKQRMTIIIIYCRDEMNAAQSNGNNRLTF